MDNLWITSNSGLATSDMAASVFGVCLSFGITLSFSLRPKSFCLIFFNGGQTGLYPSVLSYMPFACFVWSELYNK